MTTWADLTDEQRKAMLIAEVARDERDDAAYEAVLPTLRTIPRLTDDDIANACEECGIIEDGEVAEDVPSFIRRLRRERDEAIKAESANNANQRAQLADAGLLDEFAAWIGCDLIEHVAEGLVRARCERDEVRERLRWYHAAHLLIAQHEAFPRLERQETFTCIDGEATTDGNLRLCLVCSDTFGYACADAEDADYADAPALLDLAVREGWPGLARWIADRRHQRGEPVEPIPPVAAKIRAFDDLRRERDEARAEALAEAARRCVEAVRSLVVHPDAPGPLLRGPAQILAAVERVAAEYVAR